jgi:hypothetical protein
LDSATLIGPVSASVATQEALWIRSLLREWGLSMNMPRTRTRLEPRKPQANRTRGHPIPPHREG